MSLARFRRLLFYGTCMTTFVGRCYGDAMKHVKFQTDEICKLAVKQNGYSLRFVCNELLTNEIYSLAFQTCGHALKYVKEEFKTEEICKLAVKQDGNSLCYITEQTDDICKLAVLQNVNALKYVKNIELKDKINKLLNA